MKVYLFKAKKNVDKSKKTRAGENPMKSILKKNQIVLVATALMLITAGYMNYNNNNKLAIADLGDAKLVSVDAEINDESAGLQNENLIEGQNESEEKNITNSNNENETSNNKEENDNTPQNEANVKAESISQNNDYNTTTETSTKVDSINKSSSNYFSQAKLERDTMYSQMLETYQKILENEKIPNEQKNTASAEIKSINDRKNSIFIIESLIKNKGFENSVILVNDNNIDVIVKSDVELTKDQIAQIEDIVSRELKADIQDIHITVHK